jgi:hypothetical protein
MFATRFWADLTPQQTDELLPQVVALARSNLYKQDQWWADYRRLQIVARQHP